MARKQARGLHIEVTAPSMFHMSKEILNHSTRVVIKVGSALLVDPASGALRADWLRSLAEDIASLRAKGKEVLVVSSGAIALGRWVLGQAEGALLLPQKQAAAACGQRLLTEGWEQAFATQGFSTGQILLTAEDSDHRRRYINARNTLLTLLEAGIVPVINENDTITTQEIRVGDNDRLAARVAQMVEADVLWLLSDVDGLYTRDPRQAPEEAEHIPTVHLPDARVEAMASERAGAVGTGGMRTKLMAARMATESGCHTLISCGTKPHPLKAVWQDQARVTHFVAQDTPHNARQRWLMHQLQVQGKLVIDGGALRALQAGNSLLPAGVVGVEGDFARGDAVAVVDSNGVECARGLVVYHAQEAQAILGKQSEAIEAVLGYIVRPELIHRDDLVFVGT